MNDEIKILVIEQARNKINELSTWRRVRYHGGRFYYEAQNILHEIKDYSDELKLIYLETIFKSNFIIQDNFPSSAPDITQEIKDWLQQQIIKSKINLLPKSISDTLKDKLIPINNLNLKEEFKSIIELRLIEIEVCYINEAYLSCMILIGSTLEGLLLNYSLLFPKEFSNSKSSPKDKTTNKVIEFHKWNLRDLIQVAYEVGLIKEDTKKMSNVLRDFRNYVHPNEQIKSNFIPDKETIKLQIEVLNLCFKQISNF